MEKDLRALVFDALDNAVRNGFNPLDDCDGQIADELACYDADLEGTKADILIPFIRAWRAART